MSSRYTADGRRISSMTHARQAHTCSLCQRVSYGNGGEVAHSRSHVRRGEAVELVKEYGHPAGTSRVFLAPDDERMDWFMNRGFEVRPWEPRSAPEPVE